MTPPLSHQEIAELFIKNNIHVISDKPFAGSLAQAKKLYKTIKNNKKSFTGLHIIIRPTQWLDMLKKLVEDKKDWKY